MNGKPLCSAITSSGGRCKARALEGQQWCWNHSPGTAEERKSNAAQGGRSRSRGGGSSGKLRRLERRIDDATRGVLEGRIPRETGAVVFQGFHVQLRCLDLQEKAREREELEQRLTELESRTREQRQGYRRYN